MEAVQLKKFKRALEAQQAVAIHDLGENREIIAVERSRWRPQNVEPSFQGEEVHQSQGRSEGT